MSVFVDFGTHPSNHIRRVKATPRPGWQALCEDCSLSFHSPEGGYWDESARYAVSADAARELQRATAELYALCMRATEHVFNHPQLLARFGFSPQLLHAARASWARRDPAIMGRFDLTHRGDGAFVMLEFNAETPLTTLETGLVARELDEPQFNTLDEHLVARWGELGLGAPPGARPAC